MLWLFLAIDSTSLASSLFSITVDNGFQTVLDPFEILHQIGTVILLRQQFVRFVQQGFQPLFQISIVVGDVPGRRSFFGDVVKGLEEIFESIEISLNVKEKSPLVDRKNVIAEKNLHALVHLFQFFLDLLHRGEVSAIARSVNDENLRECDDDEKEKE